MLDKKKNIIFWSLFGAIFIILLLIATFFDLQISQILATKGLQNGQYFSKNVFGRIFEVIGEMPLYLFVMVACEIVMINFDKASNKAIKIIFKSLFFCIGVLINFYGLKKFGDYLNDLWPGQVADLTANLLSLGLLIILSIDFQALTHFILDRNKELMYKLLPFACVTLFTAALSNGIVQGIKPIFARERFRAIYVLDYKGLEHQGYTKWFIIHGNSKELASAYDDVNITKTYFQSFPSGHTCAAAITYSLFAIPYFFENIRKSKKSLIFVLSPIVYTGIVALSRIVMGAHYMSDVLFGGTITFLCMILGLVLYSFIEKKIASKIPKEELVEETTLNS